MLGKIEGKRRREQQGMRWLDSITDSMDVNLSKLWNIVGEGNGNPLQYSCLENSMDGRAWQATVHEVTKSRTHLSAHACTQIVLEVKTVCCGTKQWCVT